MSSRFAKSAVFSGALSTFALIAAVSAAPAMALAYDTEAPREGLANETPKQLQNVGIDEHLGEKINLDLKFKNEDGKEVSLHDYFHDGKPVLLSLAYYDCPSLCSTHLNGLMAAFRAMKEPLGREFNVLVVSIDPREKSDLAKTKRAAYLKAYDRPEGADGWHFLVGDEPQIKELAKEVGFKYYWSEEQQQFAHASAAYVLTPQGQISRYLNGIVFDPKTVRLSMVEASNGTIASITDKLVLFCFHFDPKSAKYSLAAFNVVRAGGLMVLAVMAAFMIPFWRRNRRDEEHQGEA